MYGLTLLLVLVLMGGIIAYIGDRIGKSVGKKRLTVFGLRPRHTSIFVTIITGILIATFSLTALSIASYDVRTALFGIQELKLELDVLSDSVEEKDEELETLQGSYDILTGEVEKKEQHLVEMEEELESRIEEVSELTQARDVFKQDLERVRDEDIIFQANEELASAVVKSDDIDEIWDILRALIEDAVDFAVYHGAAPANEDGSIIYVRQPELQAFENIIEYFIEKDRIEELIDEELISEDMIIEGLFVRLVARTNTVHGEPVDTKFELYPNLLVFEEGEKIASTVIDGTQSKHEIQYILFEELLQDVNTQARNRGMLPRSLEGEVGQIDYLYLFDIVDIIDEKDSLVHVTAYAAHDAWTKPPLHIELSISEP